MNSSAGPEPRSPAASAGESRPLTRLYIAALSAVALLSIGGQLVVQTRLQRQSADATIVNIAGRQRMISQRLAKCALAVAAASSDGERTARAAELRQWLPVWRRCHLALQKGDAELAIPYVDDAQSSALFRRIDPSFQAMYEGASRLAADLESRRAVSPQAVETILAHEAEFLRGMDEIVSHFELQAQQRVGLLRRVESLLLALTLAVLLLEGILVFRPAARRIRESFAALSAAHEELRLAKNSAEAANQAKTRFLANVSHELRTPLHAVLGSVELLEQTPLDARGRECAATIGDAARAQLGLVNDMLDLSTIESGKAELRLGEFSLRSMVERTATMLRPLAAARGLALVCRVDASVPAVVVGDELRLRQVLVNLMNNAIKFTDKGTIDCHVEASDGPTSAGVRSVRVRFQVADTGIGIAENDRRHIFDRFTQVDDSSRRRQGGAGLGLAISAQWVERMGGRIEVESRLGEGSRFGFELSLPLGRPDAPSEALTDARAAGTAVSGRSLRILLADDAPAGRLIVAELLKQAGHEVEAVADGRAAVEAIAKRRFDAALIDLQMPDVDGPSAVAEIRRREREENRPRLPIAALTADAISHDGKTLEEAGFDAKLTKPISAAALLAALAKLVDDANSTAVATSYRDFESRTSNGSPRGSALDRLRGNEKLLSELTEMFSAEASTAVERLKAGLASGDDEIVFQTAHRLRGQLLLIGADDAAQIAEAIEAAGHEGRTELAAARMNELTSALDRIVSA
jgi:signal transduction histidine kinase/DNA-binding response OmpR family regulator